MSDNPIYAYSDFFQSGAGQPGAGQHDFTGPEPSPSLSVSSSSTAPPLPKATNKGKRRATSGSEGGSGHVGSSGGWDENASGVKKETSVTPPGGTDKSGKIKRTRVRLPSSCANCRRSKRRCNRGNPCLECTSHVEECNWEGATPLFDARATHDAEALRDQVARLEALVEQLTSQKEANNLAAGANSHRSSLSGAETPESPSFEQFPSASRPSIGESPSENPRAKQKMDLRANDLCEALSQLAIKEFVHVADPSGGDSWAPGGGRGDTFVEEAKIFLATMPQAFGITGSIPRFDSSSSFNSSGGGLPSGFAGPASEGVASPMTSDYGGPGGGASLSPSPLGSAAFHRSAPPVSEMLRFLPSDAQAMSAYTYYASYVSWYAHGVHLPSFESQWADMKQALKLDEEQRNRAIDPFFVATFLGICATGLAMMPVKRAQRDGFGTAEDKNRTVDSWLEGAMVALTCGKFMDNPSVESVRAVSVLATYFVFCSSGESSGAGMGLLSLVVQVAMSLGLHRDPDRMPGKFTFFEAESRRRLFWGLFSLCILSSASLGRTWAVFDLNGVDTKLPLDCHDHEIMEEATALAGTEARRRKFEETPMTSLIVKTKLAVQARKINDEAFGIRPVSYAQILELDKQLREFEESIPSRYKLRLDSVGALVRPSAHITVTEMRACMIQISLASEFIRIHRPWIVLAGSSDTFQYSRDQAVKYAKLTLAIFRSPSCNKHPWGGLTYKATSAAIVLAVEMLTFPYGGEVDALRVICKATADQMEARQAESSLCRKGARIIRFLLEKEAILVAHQERLREEQRAIKRTRTTDEANSFPARTIRPAFDSRFDFAAGSSSPAPRGAPARPPAPSPTAPVDLPPYQHSPYQYMPSAAPAPPAPRTAVPLPRQRAPPPPTSRPEQAEFANLDFGSPLSGLGDFSFDFAVPSGYDLAGGVQYHLDSPSLNTPHTGYAPSPAYMPTPSSHLGSPAIASAYDFVDHKAPLSRSAPPSSQPPSSSQPSYRPAYY